MRTEHFYQRSISIFSGEKRVYFCTFLIQLFTICDTLVIVALPDAHFIQPGSRKSALLTFQRRQRLNLAALLIDVEARAHLAAVLFNERTGEIQALCDGCRWWRVIVVEGWGCRCDRNAWR